jgi:D-glucuronyl C5-epimerase C-terminus
VSGMAQATGLEALTRAVNRLNEQSWLGVMPRALKLFQLPSPTGVRVPTRAGAHYLQYSFAPGTRIVNAFEQAILGLYQAADESGSALARKLAETGDKQLRVELPLYDTGAWVLYELGGAESDLNYFDLARSFLHKLCLEVSVNLYCNTYYKWRDYKRAPPVAKLLTTRVIGGRPVNVAWRQDKLGTIGLVIDDPDGNQSLFRSGFFYRGVHSFPWTPPKKPGEYAVRMSGTNFVDRKAEYPFTIKVVAPPSQ